MWKIRPASERRVKARHDLAGQFSDDVVDPARGGGAVALDGEERLGERDRDLGGIERRHRAVAPDDLTGRFA